MSIMISLRWARDPEPAPRIPAPTKGSNRGDGSGNSEIRSIAAMISRKTRVEVDHL
jgi:hypothetical protein